MGGLGHPSFPPALGGPWEQAEMLSSAAGSVFGIAGEVKSHSPCIPDFFFAIWCHLLFYGVSAPQQGDLGLFPLVNAILGGWLFILWLEQDSKAHPDTSKSQGEPGVTPQDPQPPHPRGLSPRSKPCPSTAAARLSGGIWGAVPQHWGIQGNIPTPPPPAPPRPAPSLP